MFNTKQGKRGDVKVLQCFSKEKKCKISSFELFLGKNVFLNSEKDKFKF